MGGGGGGAGQGREGQMESERKLFLQISARLTGSYIKEFLHGQVKAIL